MNREIWRPVFEALDIWHAADLRAPLWLRDDDSIEPTPPLDRLVDLAARHEIPLALAVVPANAGEALARDLRTARHVTAIVHGWAHRNHAPEGEKKEEFGAHRAIETMRQELSLAISRIRDLFPDRMAAMFVPPWNRIATELIPILRELGYAALSTFGVSIKNRGIAEINTHVDIIDFRGTRRCREHSVLAKELAAALSHSFHHGRYAVGILSHHLVHDEAAFEFLASFLSIAREESWLSAPQLIERRTGLAG
jgi:Polysaccharide deacetylase